MAITKNWIVKRRSNVLIAFKHIWNSNPQLPVNWLHLKIEKYYISILEILWHKTILSVEKRRGKSGNIKVFKIFMFYNDRGRICKFDKRILLRVSNTYIYFLLSNIIVPRVFSPFNLYSIWFWSLYLLNIFWVTF